MLALQVFRDGTASPVQPVIEPKYILLGGRDLLIVSPAWYEAASLRAVPSD